MVMVWAPAPGLFKEVGGGSHFQPGLKQMIEYSWITVGLSIPASRFTSSPAKRGFQVQVPALITVREETPTLRRAMTEIE